MKRMDSFIFGAFLIVPSYLMAGNVYYLNFPVLPDPNAGSVGTSAVKNSGVCIVRDQVPNQIAYQVAGPDGTGVGRIFSNMTPNYVLTDVGSQFSTSVVSGQSILSIVECFDGQFGWNGPTFVAGSRITDTYSSIIGGRLIEPSLELTQLWPPVLQQASPNHISFKIPAYDDAGGQASAFQLWRQGSDGNWLALAQLPLTGTAQIYTDVSVTAGASYWYGVSVAFGWPGGYGEGALPAGTGQFVSHARAVSTIMVAADVQPTPTVVPTLAPDVNHDVGQAGWEAGPNPSKNGHFRIQFHTDKPGTWQLKTFTLDGTLANLTRGSVSQKGWQVAGIDLSKQASGLYLMDLRVTQEGETEKALPIGKVAIIR